MFLFIISRIDRSDLFLSLQNANPVLLALSFVSIFAIYIIKTFRWHLLVQTAGLKTAFWESWRLYMIGIFLSTITPGKIGELGRVGYLRQLGLGTAVAISIGVFDRGADLIIVAIASVMAFGWLFGWRWGVIWLLLGTTMAWLICFGYFLLNRKRKDWHWLTMIGRLMHPRIFFWLLLWTVLAVFCGCLWFILINWSIGITLPPPQLMAIFIITGMVSIIPIAPSGLGTRETALLMLFTPFAIPAELSVSLGLLMFVSIILSGLPGGYYFLRGISR